MGGLSLAGGRGRALAGPRLGSSRLFGLRLPFRLSGLPWRTHPTVPRWEIRLTVLLPVVLLFLVLGLSSLGFELTLRVIGPLAPERALAVQKVRIVVVAVSALASALLGVALAADIVRPLRRLARLAATRVESQGTIAHTRSVNEILDLSNTLTSLLRAYDRATSRARLVETLPVGVVVIEEEGRVKASNREGQRLLGAWSAIGSGAQPVRCLGGPPAVALMPLVRGARETRATTLLPPLPWSGPGAPATVVRGLVAPFSDNGRSDVLLVLKDVSASEPGAPEVVRDSPPTAPDGAIETVTRAPALATNGHRHAGFLSRPRHTTTKEEHAAPTEDRGAERNHKTPARSCVSGGPPPPARGEGSVPELVDGLIRDALLRRASDIHLDSAPDGLDVRFRIDGLLRHITSVPVALRAAVVSRLKIMANMDIVEHRLPQDGRIRLHEHGRAVDARVSTAPSLYGETVVLRLLDLQAVALPLPQCGLGPDHLEELRRLVRRPQGVIFVTGPTGSGKTSTIYACLNDIKSETTNIITIEDPVEYEIAGITQIAVHEKVGLTFAKCLRSVLRQDPDVILVGEVRDLETARTAMQASLTGHLVFSTVHTNDAVGAITRLLDMEIPPYLIASSLNAIVAQRLPRLLCPECKVPWEADAATRRMLGAGAKPLVLYRPAGCERCFHSGVVGRTGIFEILVVNQRLRQLITARACETKIRAAARAARMRSLFEDGRTKVLEGRVAYEELLRVVEPDESA